LEHRRSTDLGQKWPDPEFVGDDDRHLTFVRLTLDWLEAETE
jgi:hypothetical protein